MNPSMFRLVPLPRMDFSKDTPVLQLGARPLGGSSGRPQWLLWPAWCWKVLGEKPRRRALNVFERASLGLCQAGKRSALDQADLLGLDVELCKLILLNLQGLGLLDERGVLTDRAEALLQGREAEAGELVTGHLFQDPDSGALWPRFVEQLSYAEVDFQNADGWPRLVRGSSGNPQRFRLEMLFPDNDTPPAPLEAKDILRAIQLSARARRTDQQTALLQEADDALEGDRNGGERSMAEAEADALSDPLSNAQLQRVRCLDEQPRPVFLLTCLYLPMTEGDEAGWCVSDPFGQGDSILLRRWIEAQLLDAVDSGATRMGTLDRRNRPGERLKALLQTLLGTEVRPEKLTLDQWQSQLHQRAIRELDQRFPIMRRDERTRAFYQRLLSFEQSWQEAVEQGQKCPPEKLQAVLINAQLVLEALFQRIWREAGRPDLARSLPQKLVLASNGRTQNEGLWEDAARRLGFEVPLPQSLSRVRAGKVIPALERGRASLRPLLLAALMLAVEVPGHPFWRAAPRFPSLLRELDGLAEHRDKVAHDSDQSISIEQVEKDREIVYRALQSL